ncbi:o-succinylbenzoate synthase [Psychromonas arctica]|uniref:o-succinylbenzoate synthase n=1 Tax=Psychromonas arctica TaxID=168275 RepID=UPI002FD0A837
MYINKLNELFENTNKCLSLYRFSLSLQNSINFNGHKLKQRQGLWLVKRSVNGDYSIGEIAPLPGFSHETLNECEDHLLALLHSSTINQQQIEILQTLPSVQFAIHCLLQQISWKTTPNFDQQSVPLLQGKPADIIQRYKTLNNPSLVKLKVARLAVEQEIQLIKELIQINPKIRFRLDANQQWNKQIYRFFLTKIKQQYIDYIEEPTQSMASNIKLAQQFKSTLGLDESLLTTTTLPVNDSIKALILKPTLIGDENRIHYLLRHAQQYKLQVCMSSSFESPIALNQLHVLAQQWQKQTQLDVQLGLDTQQAFTSKIQDREINTSAQLESYLKEAKRLW